MLIPSRKCNYRCNSSALASKMICSEVLVILVQGKGTFVTYLGIHSSATLPRNEAASFDEIYTSHLLRIYPDFHSQTGQIKFLPGLLAEPYILTLSVR